MINTVLVSPATVQLVASESSRCAGAGGDFYAGEDVRAHVPIPAGSTQLFPGCYDAPNTSCLDAFLPPSGNKVLRCADDLTRLLFAVAPPGRGPVITSLDDLGVTGTAGGPTIAQAEKVQPIVWCITEGPCILLVEAAPLALELVEVAPVALAGISWVVVAAGGIGLGLVLAALLLILFPTPIGLVNFFEYPIDPDADFDTFDNWGLDEGEWYNDLKLYAEVVETTKQLAARNSIPFAWNDSRSQRLKRIIDIACSTQQGVYPASAGCGDDFAVYVPGAQNYLSKPMVETGKHIVTALGDGSFPQPPSRATWYYPARSINGQAARNAGFRRNWFDTAQFQPNACTGRPAGLTCDEYPFWSTNQAVNLSGQVASLKPVSNAESLPQANDLSGFYRKCRVSNNQRFIVLPVKPWVEAGGPSFAFRVSPSGASVCMAPGI